MPTPEPSRLIYPAGTRVVVRKDVPASNGRVAHPAGAVGVVVRCPVDRTHAYRVRFSDGFEAPVRHEQLVRLAEYKTVQSRPAQAQTAQAHPAQATADESPAATDAAPIDANLQDRVILRCVIGSRAYGLDDETSDTDRRGVYLPSAERHWSLFGVPEQLENDATQEAYWELQKFLVLALKANPNVLECLYSPLVEHATPLGKELLAMRDAFLSKLIYQTFSGYVASQFKKMQTDLRNQGRVKPKHVMHLIRLLISGTRVLTEGRLMMDVGDHRERLMSIKRGDTPLDEADHWRRELQDDFGRAFQTTDLPDRPDYERVNAFLIDARRRAIAPDLP